MADPYLSQIELFAFNFAPKGWLMCTGQLLPINQYQALFALLGTTFGGNGVSNFQLPDLRGRLAIGMGNGSGLTPYIEGETVGQVIETVTMAQMPGAHTHSLNANTATSGGTRTPASNAALSSVYVASTTPAPQNAYSTDGASVPMGSLSPVGGQPHNNMMPYMAGNYCICISGLFPSRG
jgi:microcystin-dependent protein